MTKPKLSKRASAGGRGRASAKRRNRTSPKSPKPVCRAAKASPTHFLSKKVSKPVRRSKIAPKGIYGGNRQSPHRVQTINGMSIGDLVICKGETPMMGAALPYKTIVGRVDKIRIDRIFGPPVSGITVKYPDGFQFGFRPHELQLEGV